MSPLAPFAALQQRTNAVVMQRLANAVAQIGTGEPFGVMFDMPYADGYGGVVDGRAPVCQGPAELLGGLERGAAIAINGVAYTVDSAEPDGDGFVLLRLIKVGE